jgi:hypothetical protein
MIRLANCCRRIKIPAERNPAVGTGCNKGCKICYDWPAELCTTVSQRREVPKITTTKITVR